MKWWDRSWNPFFGCTRCSEGCDNCIIFETLMRQKRSTYPKFSENIAKNNLYSNLNYVVCSLGDLFHEKHSWQNIDQVFSNMICYPDNRYFVLTKRSGKMKEYFSDSQLPENIRDYDWASLWLGVTVENTKYLNRIEDLITTPIVQHRFLALEPLQEQISISPYLKTKKIEWVIVGAETGIRRRPTDIEWIKQIVAECQEFNVPVYVSQLEINSELQQDISKFPKELRIRETPWKFAQTQFEGYETATVLNREGVVGLRTIKQEDGVEYFDFLLQAPEFVYNYLKERTYGLYIQESELLTPITYLSPKGTPSARKLFLEAREFLTQKYIQLKDKNVPEKWIRMLLPQDVMVKFHWRMKITDWPNLVPSVETEKISELKQYFITMKILLLKWRTQNVSSKSW